MDENCFNVRHTLAVGFMNNKTQNNTTVPPVRKYNIFGNWSEELSLSLSPLHVFVIV